MCPTVILARKVIVDWSFCHFMGDKFDMTNAY